MGSYGTLHRCHFSNAPIFSASIRLACHPVGQYNIITVSSVGSTSAVISVPSCDGITTATYSATKWAVRPHLKHLLTDSVVVLAVFDGPVPALPPPSRGCTHHPPQPLTRFLPYGSRHGRRYCDLSYSLGLAVSSKTPHSRVEVVLGATSAIAENTGAEGPAVTPLHPDPFSPRRNSSNNSWRHSRSGVLSQRHHHDLLAAFESWPSTGRRSLSWHPPRVAASAPPRRYEPPRGPRVGTQVGFPRPILIGSSDFTVSIRQLPCAKVSIL